MSNPMLATFWTMAASIGIVMQNAATNQRNCQIIGTASLSVCTALIVKKGTSGS